VNVPEAIAHGTMRGRLWFYTNYHCNLSCKYCLTESRPDAPRRTLEGKTILAAADEAATLGFTDFGVTGGEPFMRPDMPQLLFELARRRPTVVLTNGTLFTDRLLDAMRPLAGAAVAVQMSLDSADAGQNDRLRGRDTFANVVAAISKLQSAGIAVRIGSTIDESDPTPLEPLRAFVTSLGIEARDHVIRPIARLGRAAASGLGISVSSADIVPELTLTAEGAFLSPAAPSVTGDALDIELLLTRTIYPVAIPAAAMLRFVGAQPAPSAYRVTCA